jgi:hypothetical protein
MANTDTVRTSFAGIKKSRYRNEVTTFKQSMYGMAVTGYLHIWASSFSPFENDNFRLFLRKQTDKRQTSICTMSKR